MRNAQKPPKPGPHLGGGVEGLNAAAGRRWCAIRGHRCKGCGTGQGGHTDHEPRAAPTGNKIPPPVQGSKNFPRP